MRPPHATASATGFRGLFEGPEGSCGRVVVSWTAAGGVAGGGILVGSLTIAGYVSPGLQLLAAPVLFLLGALLGAVHGAVLAVAGRPETLSAGGALKKACLSVLVALPLLFPAWVVTAGISLTAALVGEWRLTWGLLSLGGWLFGLALCGWAVREGWLTLRCACARWPEARLGGALVVAFLVVASLVLADARPGIWGTDLRLNGVGAVILAGALTLWVGLPLVWAVLHVAHGWLPPHAGGGEAGT